jgi:hypothetical protein
VNDVPLPKGGAYPQKVKDLGFNSDLNIATLYNPLFLLGESLTQVTSKINEITNISIFEEVNKVVKGRLLKLRATVKVQEENILEEVTTLDKLIYVKERLQVIEELEDKQKLLNSYRDSLENKNNKKQLQEKLVEIISKIENTNSLESYKDSLKFNQESQLYKAT